MDKLLLANANCQLKNIVRSCRISAVHKSYYTNFAYARVLGLNTISADHNGEKSQTKKVKSRQSNSPNSAIQLVHCTKELPSMTVLRL